MDKFQDLVNEIDRILSEEMNNVIAHPLYNQIKSLYPQSSATEISYNIKKELLKFNNFIKTLNLAYEYKELCDYIAENDVPTKAVNLLSLMDDSVSFDGFEKEKLNSANERIAKLKVELKSLGFSKFYMLENEILRRKSLGNKLEQKDMNDYEYLELVFSECRDSDSAFKNYCLNLNIEDGLKEEKLKMAYKILRKEEIISGEKEPGWKTLSSFSEKIKMYYRKAGLL